MAARNEIYTDSDCCFPDADFCCNNVNCADSLEMALAIHEAAELGIIPTEALQALYEEELERNYRL